RRDALGDRQRADPEAPLLVAPLQVERQRIVQSRCNALRLQVSGESVSIPEAHHIEVIDRPASFCFERSGDVWNIGQQFVVARRGRATLRVPGLEVWQLRPQKGRLNGVQPPVVALEVVVILLRLAVLPEHPDGPRHLLVVGGDGSALATRAEVLPRLYADSGGPAVRARVWPCA